MIASDRTLPATRDGARASRAVQTSWLLGWLAVLAVGVFASAHPAAAHPHVWIVARAEVIVEGGQVVGLRHRWAFDEGYTKMAIEGLDANGDGTYDRAELAELAQVNIEGLKEFDYFTRVRAGAKAVANGAPKDYHLEHTAAGELALVFTLMLAEPVALPAKDLTIEISDPTIFIDFRFDKTEAVAIAGSPAGCKASLEAQKGAADQVARLGQAFAAEMQGMVNINLPQHIRIACPA